MNWFEALTGFQEESYEKTRAKLSLEGRELRSLVNGRTYEVGQFELLSLAQLRERVASANGVHGQLKVGVVVGDVRQMHRARANADALFQVASQFNMLEMISPNVTPEDGVGRYENDHTQGPSCAMAAGAATIYRNYFVPVQGEVGQTANRQLDGLAALGMALSEALDKPIDTLWQMRNGYALCDRPALDCIVSHLGNLLPHDLDALRAKLCIGLHWDTEVTDLRLPSKQHVSQASCSALPVSYSPVPAPCWRDFAVLVLEAAYEATLWSAVLNAARGVSNVVFLTLLGGGAFGNNQEWIIGAMERAFRMASSFEIEVRIVSFDDPAPAVLRLDDAFR